MPTIASVPELRSFLGLEPGRGEDDLILAMRLDSAEEFVAMYTGRSFAPEPAFILGADTGVAVTKTFPVRRGEVVVRIPDLRSATAVSLGGSHLIADMNYVLDTNREPATSIILDQYAWQFALSPFISTLSSMTRLSITGRWGFSPVPAGIKDAVLTIAARRFHEKKSMFQDSVALPDGSVLSYFRQLPASVQGALNQYRSVKVALV